MSVSVDKVTLYPGSSSDYTYIVDNQTKFDNWFNNTSGNDYSHVLIKGSYTITSNKTFNPTTKTITGAKGAELCIYSINSSIYYTTDSTYLREINGINFISYSRYGYFLNIINCASSLFIRNCKFDTLASNNSYSIKLSVSRDFFINNCEFSGTGDYNQIYLTTYYVKLFVSDSSGVRVSDTYSSSQTYRNNITIINSSIYRVPNSVTILGCTYGSSGYLYPDLNKRMVPILYGSTSGSSSTSGTLLDPYGITKSSTWTSSNKNYVDGNGNLYFNQLFTNYTHVLAVMGWDSGSLESELVSTSVIKKMMNLSSNGSSITHWAFPRSNSNGYLNYKNTSTDTIWYRDSAGWVQWYGLYGLNLNNY